MRVELTLAEPQSAVPPQHFGPVKFGPPRRNRTFVLRLSSARSAIELQADGAADGIRTHVVLVGNEVPDF